MVLNWGVAEERKERSRTIVGTEGFFGSMSFFLTFLTVFDNRRRRHRLHRRRYSPLNVAQAHFFFFSLSF